MNLFLLGLLLLLFRSLASVKAFLPSTIKQYHPTRSTTALYSSLEDRTIKELWQIVEEADLLERGIKTRLKRKQDIIGYIQEQHLTTTNKDKIQEDAVQQQHTNTERSGANQEKIINKNDNNTQQTLILSDIQADIASKFPPFLKQHLIQKGITSLLPIQVQSFHSIYAGEDAVLQAPTGSGKTLAVVLPLVARKWKGGIRQKVAAPLVLVLAPSRELARQVGNEFAKFSSINKGASATSSSVVTVYGGIPMERHIAMLKSKPQILVATPGRLRELVREGHVEYSQVTTLVLDEADSLLDKADSPDVQAILQDLETTIADREVPEYQMVLVSATINQHVVEFAREMEIPATALIRVQGSESKVVVKPSSSSSSSGNKQHEKQPLQHNTPLVQHWHMPCKASVRPAVLADLISIMAPRLAIVFVATKTETESVASYLSSKLGGGIIRILHGDMQQNARSRSIALIRQAAEEGLPQILITTDVLSRGIDLNCDLVVQFGVPRIAGKEGTFSTELYTHRTGRTGRVRVTGMMENANAIMLYDPAAGEGKLIPPLANELNSELGVEILPRPLPSSSDVVEAGYKRARELIALNSGVPAAESNNDLTTYFRSKLEEDESIDTSNAQELLDYLSKAMTALSNLDSSVSPFEQHNSLLSGSDADHTLRLYREDGESLTPPEVTRYCKDLGSGKLGRVIICEDGSAIFDLPRKKAKKLVDKSKAIDSSDDDWHLELPLVLPKMLL